MTTDRTLQVPRNEIELAIDAFISWVKSRIEPQNVSARASVWLMLEHYQFSKRNPRLLMRGAEILGGLLDQRIARTLLDNYLEEKDHPRAYRRGLREYEVYVEERTPFPATSGFLDKLMSIVETGPSQALGALYATESAALLEHQLLDVMSRRLAIERGIVYADSALAEFHALHLNGVEERHAQELGIFLHEHNADLEPEAVIRGGKDAIAAMTAWWEALLSVLWSF